jgi:uncharacterized protein
MPYFIITYDLVEDYLNRRTEYRDQHLRLAREAHDRGELILAGALSDPADRALLVFHVTQRSMVEEFAKKDPYVINGLVKKWEVRPWTVVIGGQPEASSSPRS